MGKVFIIDDDAVFCDMLSRTVERLGHSTGFAHTLKEGLRQVREGDYDVVFLDVRMPDGTGLDALPDIRSAPSGPEVIIITGLGDPDGAELAIKNGAWDYIEKPFSTDEMLLPLMRALQYREEKKSRKRPLVLKRDRLVGQSPQIQACLDLLAQAAVSQANVLITGETGTGKELFARTMHENSVRSEKPFVVVDCSALPETLAESLLFGHVKGAFTSADQAREGLVKQAHGGTLFMDEVGELPLTTQKTFLRVLEERRFRPLGAKNEMESDFRLAAATNRDLDEMVRKGEFREDLLFRLRTICLEIPPLRSRRGDLQVLTTFYLTGLCRRYNMATKGVSPEFFDVLESYSWPGNVRELFHSLETAVTAAWNEPTLFSAHLPPNIRIGAARANIGRDSSEASPDSESETVKPRLATLKEVRESVEKQYLKDLMTETAGRINLACQVSGLSRARLYELLKKHGVSRQG